MSETLQRVAVLTSGGDSPGMNAAVRAVVRFGVANGLEIVGVRDGYLGLYEGRYESLDNHSVSETLNRGGTFIGSARFPEFTEVKIRQQALERMQEEGIQALVVIGGDGSYRGAQALTDMGMPCIGLPGTIDNDIPGTDFCIGFYTALNTVLESIDRLRDTSSSHHRVSLVEIMGRHCGDLTLQAAIGGGVEYCIVPERPFDKQALIDRIHNHMAQGKNHAIIAVTENICDTHELAKEIQQVTGYESRATILGHVQRGGVPTAFDRILASRMGAYAVQLLLQGEQGRCVGIQNGELTHLGILEALDTLEHPFDEQLYQLSLILS